MWGIYSFCHFLNCYFMCTSKHIQWTILLFHHDHVCNLPLNSVTVQTLILQTVFEVGNFVYILATLLRARGWCLVCCPHSVSLSQPYQHGRVGSQWGTPAQSVVGRMGQSNHHSQAPAGWGERRTTHHLEVWAWLLPLMRDLTVPTGNAVPFTPTPKDTGRDKAV